MVLVFPYTSRRSFRYLLSYPLRLLTFFGVQGMYLNQALVNKLFYFLGCIMTLELSQLGLRDMDSAEVSSEQICSATLEGRYQGTGIRDSDESIELTVERSSFNPGGFFCLRGVSLHHTTVTLSASWP